MNFFTFHQTNSLKEYSYANACLADARSNHIRGCQSDHGAREPSVTCKNGKSIGTLAGSITEKDLTENHANKKLDVRAYENATLALSDLAIGRADAVIYSDDAGAYIAKINNLPVRPAVPVNREVNAMVFKKGEKAFEEALNAAYTSIRDDGTYRALSAKWLGTVDMVAELKKAAN
ncbi:transporter substrate-binding domain-containing protein [Microvirga sp. VF16]|uniref:transporter substrate-binding domain-containing protein n=1 Tax=Microvirga sp. VF16 TaxID=2807101 RepID=UPI00193CA5EA|nr:transporter substrate-binding domain-containing protein [Microvirga sp. VF16]QRM33213.1 transporter substrate-binding domain-containing protein [Microvirga sp. VF16]